MTNRHRGVATIASDKRAIGTCPSRRAHRNRRRAASPAGIFVERKARDTCRTRSDSSASG